MFWRAGGGKVYGRKLGDSYHDEAMVRQVLTDYLQHPFPEDCRIDMVDCRQFYGDLGWGHVGLHPTIQAGYMQNRQALTAMCRNLVSIGVTSTVQHPSLRVLVFYCNAGEHRSTAFAALTGAFLREKRNAQVLLK